MKKSGEEDKGTSYANIVAKKMYTKKVRILK